MSALAQTRCRTHAWSSGSARHGHPPCRSAACAAPLERQHRSRRRVAPRAAGRDAPGTRKELPMFPLNVVALPHATTPLMIFEPRYRVLFSTLMDGAPDVEEGLVQKDSPFAGTRRFGMCYSDGTSGRMASVGTTLEITAHTLEPDGRILVVNKGLERFRVTKVVKERPVLICEVEVLPEDEDGGDEAAALAGQVAEAFRGVLRLHRKMRRGDRGMLGAAERGAGLGGAGPGEPEDEPEEPEELTELAPAALSYWIASVFGEHPATQQALLEEASTLERLKREAEVLGQTLSFYSAAAALEGVFSGDGGAGGAPPPAPPAGGPD
ncbi:MAG: PUA-like domain-containing protein [Monoraphidium minutum]|nr:MAG: PUA-like domain-containing protein [Monoraphidium minutum]